MTLRDPIWLLALLVIPLLVLLLTYSDVRAGRRLRSFAAERLLKGLVRGESAVMRWGRFGLIAATVALLAVALARPQGGEKVEQLESSGADVLFAIDTSRSMLAEDLAPDRLTRAKLAILEMLDQLAGHRVGLVAFAGSAFLQCPLTLDHAAFHQALDAMDAGVIPTPGTNLAAAIAEAQEALTEGERPKFLILLTDGEDLEAAGLRQARQVEDVTVITVGVGTPEGGLVPASAENPDGGVTRNAAGEMVVSKLDPSTLEAIAQETGGFYIRLQPGAVEQIYERAIADAEGAMAEQEIRTPIERFQWPLAGAIFLLLLEPLMGLRRRKGALVMLMLAVILLPEEARAASEAEAYRFLQNEDYPKAEAAYQELLKDGKEDARAAYNLGVAQYRDGKMGEAAASFEKAIAWGEAIDGKAAYNAGTAYLKQATELARQAPEEATKVAETARGHFEAALGNRPEWKEARENLSATVELIEQLERQQQPPQEQQDSDSQDQKQNEEQQEQQESSSEQQQNQEEQEQGEQQEQENAGQEQGEQGQEGQQQQGEQSGQQGQDGQQGGQQQQSGQQGQDGQQAGQQQDGQQGQEGQQQQNGQGQQGQEEQQGQSGAGEEGQQQEEAGQSDDPQEGRAGQEGEEESQSGSTGGEQTDGQSEQEQAGGQASGGEEDPYAQDAEAARGAESGLEAGEQQYQVGEAGEGAEAGEGEPVGTIMLTREQAERLLRALQREEKMLPAGKLLEPTSRGEGRDW